jgi:Ner family transcriptional regulator
MLVHECDESAPKKPACPGRFARGDVMARRWDRFLIKAEIHRRGSTLTRVAAEAGVDGSTTRHALIRRSPAGERAISNFLGVPLIELWPERYRFTTSGVVSTARPRGRTSQKHCLPSDIGDAA